MSDILVFAVLAVPVAFFAGWYALTPWLVHRDMTRDYSKGYRHGTVAQFWTEFDKRQWKRLQQFPDSWFCFSDDSEIHASIIRFSGRGMVLSPWGWYSVKRQLRARQTRAWAEDAAIQ